MSENNELEQALAAANTIDSNRPEASDEDLYIANIAQIELLQISMGGTTFLVTVNEVAEVTRPIDLTPVPMAPGHLLGMANVHGQPVCIIDPAQLMDLPQPKGELTPQTRFMLLRHPRMHVGIWVDNVESLHRVNEEMVPERGDDSEYIYGSLDVGGKSIELLNSQALLH